MKYSFIEIPIRELVDLIDKSRIDLNPSYQRNFIWSSTDQKDLIDTIILNFPLPNFFLFKKTDGTYEMVDGQQRSKTIFRFVTGQITSSKKTGTLLFEQTIKENILNYKLPIVLIEELAPNESLKDFYVLINKKGVHLNVPEVNKSEFHDSNFLKLANEALEYQNFIELDLFSDATARRMNDRAFIEELLGYLHLGLKEKKRVVNTIYKDEDINEEEYGLLLSKFCQVIDVVHEFQQVKPINRTRYKQKNDFYTLFNFLNTQIHLNIQVLIYQYKILLIMDGKDKEGRQMIRPTNQDCKAFRDYAYHCVTQSNSKEARDNRLKFFNAILTNLDIENNEILTDVVIYLEEEFNIELDLMDIADYKLINIGLFNS